MVIGVTELWWRNPHNYVRELDEIGVYDFIWDHGALRKRAINLPRWYEHHLPHVTNWRAYVVGFQGATEISWLQPDFRRSQTVMPVWEYGKTQLNLLKQWAMERERVFVIGIPNLNTQAGKRTIQMLANVQADYPNCKIHLHGLDSFPVAFGLEFTTSDWNPRNLTIKGEVRIGTGRKVPYEQVDFWAPQWAEVIGMADVDLGVPRNRCLFTARSIRWASENWSSMEGFTREYTLPVKSDDFWAGRQPRRQIKVVRNARPGDMITCDQCSLQVGCKLYRQGSICTVPTSKGDEIAKHFKTRDANAAIEGLSKILAITADRAAQAVEDERLEGVLNPDATRLVDSLWKQGKDYANLITPKTPLVNINNVNGAQLTGAAAAELTGTEDDNQLTAAAFAKLEQAGWPREAITKEVVDRVVNENEVPAYIALPAGDVPLDVAVSDALVVEEELDDDSNAAPAD